MRSSRPVVALTLALVAGLALSACTSSDSTGGDDTKASTAPVTISYAYEQEFGSYNNNTSAQYAVKNSVVLNQVLRGFNNYDPTGQTVPDTEFGTFTKTSDNPLVVKYTVNPKAIWSDGVPIECSDFVLTWAAQSLKYKTGKKDPDTGADLTYFDANGQPGYPQADMPACNKGDKSFTLTYQKPFADWKALYGANEIVPAHIVEKESGVPDLIAALKTNNTAQIKKLGAFWNTGWVFTPGKFDAAISPSAGPYQISDWKAGQSITLKPNPKWWGTPPKAQTVVIRFISQDQQAQALQNGELQAMDPQPNPELLNQLKRIGNSITVTTGDQFSWEHLDYNYLTAFKDRDLREAFTKCVPRQTIVDNLIKPQNPKANILETRFLLPFQDGYSSLENLGGKAYDTVDIAGAKKILEAKGKMNMPVVIRYQTPNPRRAAEVDLIRDSCGKAGFKVKDGGTKTFFGNELDNGDFDIALFAWSGSALVSQNNATYSIGGGGNYGKYVNKQVDTWLTQLNSELDPAKQRQLETDMDKQLWSDLATVPLFAFPAVSAVANNVTGVVFNPSQNELTWNMQGWNLKQ